MAISVTGTANKTATNTLSITLNCAAGGDFSSTPNSGDLLVVMTATVSNGGTACGTNPLVSAPGGWTQIVLIHVDVGDFDTLQVFYKFASGSETTYTFSDGQDPTALDTLLLTGIALGGAANPFSADPSAKTYVSQSGASQAMTSNVPANTSSCMLSFWQTTISGGAYSTISGSPAVTGSIKNSNTWPSPFSSFTTAAAMAWTLSAGTSAVTDTATNTGTPTWGGVMFGVKQATAVANQPRLRALMGVGL